MRRIFILGAMTILAACGFRGPQAEPPAKDSFGGVVNSFRVVEGRSALLQDPRLMEAAQMHADDMVKRGYFSEASPGGPNGATLAARVAAADCDAGTSAQTIAQNVQSDAEALASWRLSPSDKEKILGGGYTVVGFGQSGGTYVLVMADEC